MIVKASIDLLLVFVNYTDPTDPSINSNSSHFGRESPSRLESPDALPPNALLFKDAVEEVSDEAGIPYWSYLLAIISEKSVADQDIMAKAMSLINKVSMQPLLRVYVGELVSGVDAEVPLNWKCLLVLRSSLKHPHRVNVLRP